MKKRLLLIPVVLVLAALIVWRLTKSRDFAYAGTIEATEVDIPARLATVITAYNVKEGDPVAAGQTLVELSDDEIKLGLDLADGDYQRAQRLYKSGSMPKEAFEHLRKAGMPRSLEVISSSPGQPFKLRDNFYWQVLFFYYTPKNILRITSKSR